VIRQRKGAKKTCCMVSELLEELGIDRDRVRQARRQLLEGIIMACRWQLDRMEQGREPSPGPSRKGRRIPVE
jgi:hypothetical protein